jgi:Icc-related predicted phosphoesterase
MRPGTRAVRILAVSDLHYALPQFDWLEKQAGQFDAVVVAGDLLDIAGHLDLEGQIVVVGKYLARIGADRPLLVSSGNHDGDEKNAAGEFVARWLKSELGARLAVDGQNVDIGPVRFTLCAWWDGPETRAEMDAHLEASRPELGREWVWIHHAPPQASPTAWTGKKDAGDAHVKELIARWNPAVVLSGHIHNAPMRSGGGWADRIGGTWVFNPGRQIGPVPTHLVLDWEAGEVTYSSLEGIDSRSLRGG